MKRKERRLKFGREGGTERVEGRRTCAPIKCRRTLNN